MIRNTHISLDPTSEARLDAINTLRYTLFLNHQMPDIDDMLSDPDRNLKEIFTLIMKKTQSCCKGLFVDKDEDEKEAKDENGIENKTKSKNIIYYNFFGTRNPGNKVYSPLDYLDSHPAIDNKNKSKKLPGLHTMILQHCIFSSYHAILTELTKDQWISSYKMENNIKGKGVHSLYKKGKISFDARGIVFNERNEDPPKKNCSRASGFSEKIERRTNMIPRIMGFFTEKTGKTSYRCRPQFSQTCYHICNMSVRYFRFLEKEKENGIRSLLDPIEKLTVGLEPRIESLDQIQERAFEKFDGDVVDALYHYYITERIFNLNLFYALVKNIQCIEMQTSYRLCQDRIIKVLTCCKSLPNVFSRQYFLKYAFDKIKDEPISYMNFWHYRDLERSGMIISSVRKEIMYFDFSKWLNQYKLFMGYMSKFIIPVYEWCFINMLLGTIEKRYPNEGHIDHLERAFKMLSCYIEEEYRSILQPIKLEKGMDLVDVISEHSDTKFFKDLPEDNLRQMINALIMSNVDPEGIDDIELNLHLLNPAFFDDREGNPFDNNYKRVRNMYTDLIRIMCMK